jgi:hypothetical protein
MKSIKKIIKQFDDRSKSDLLQLRDFYSTSDAPATIKDLIIKSIDSTLNKKQIIALAMTEYSEILWSDLK